MRLHTALITTDPNGTSPAQVGAMAAEYPPMRTSPGLEGYQTTLPRASSVAPPPPAQRVDYAAIKLPSLQHALDGRYDNYASLPAATPAGLPHPSIRQDLGPKRRRVSDGEDAANVDSHSTLLCELCTHRSAPFLTAIMEQMAVLHQCAVAGVGTPGTSDEHVETMIPPPPKGTVLDVQASLDWMMQSLTLATRVVQRITRGDSLGRSPNSITTGNSTIASRDGSYSTANPERNLLPSGRGYWPTHLEKAASGPENQGTHSVSTHTDHQPRSQRHYPGIPSNPAPVPPQVQGLQQTLSTLQSEHTKLQSAFERERTIRNTLARKSTVAEEEIQTLNETIQDLESNLEFAEAQVASLAAAKVELHRQVRADKEQYGKIVDLSSRLQMQAAKEEAMWRAKQEEWSKERGELMSARTVGIGVEADPAQEFELQHPHQLHEILVSRNQPQAQVDATTSGTVAAPEAQEPVSVPATTASSAAVTGPQPSTQVATASVPPDSCTDLHDQQQISPSSPASMMQDIQTMTTVQLRQELTRLRSAHEATSTALADVRAEAAGLDALASKIGGIGRRIMGLETIQSSDNEG